MTKERIFFFFKKVFAQLTLVYSLVIMQCLVVFYVRHMMGFLMLYFPFEPGPRNTRKSFKM